MLLQMYKNEKPGGVSLVAQSVILAQTSKNVLITGLRPGLLKSKLPKVTWWLMYSSGARKTKSLGLIFNSKPVELKRSSPDFVRATSCGIELLIDGENTGWTLTLHIPLEPGIFLALMRRASMPGPIVVPSIEPVPET